MAILGALTGKTEVTDINSLIRALTETLPERARKMIPVNTKVLEKGAEFVRNGREVEVRIAEDGKVLERDLEDEDDDPDDDD